MTECRLVDPATGEDCAAGAAGELWVRGPQVMLGYHGNPAAAAATRRMAGCGPATSPTIDADGCMTVVDRVKELIKVCGFQVAPAELEALLVDPSRGRGRGGDRHRPTRRRARCRRPSWSRRPAARRTLEEVQALPRGACRLATSRSGARARRRDPEVAVGEDPAAHPAGGRGAGGGGLRPGARPVCFG